MIRQPRPGQRVRLHYAVARQQFYARWQDCTGVVEIVAGRGGGPRNVQVLLDDGRRTVVCRGNLYAIGERGDLTESENAPNMSRRGGLATTRR